jgi:hypothetical protein
MNRRRFATWIGAVSAGLVVGSRLFADDQAKTDHPGQCGGTETKKKKSKHDCAGKNTCKGKGGCKTGDNGCKGKNSCKGKGGCATPKKQ